MSWVMVAATQPAVDFGWIQRNASYIGGQFLEHVLLTVLPVTFGLVIAALLTAAALHWPFLYGPFLTLTGVLFTIPSLAMFVLLVAFTGLTLWTAVIPLTVYTLLILLRNFVTGFRGVPVDVRDAATAMGFTGARRIVSVDLPLALPVIFAGIRIATVTTIGLVTVSSLVGQGGLGQLFLDGFYRSFPTPLYVGLTLSVALAVGCDLSLLWLSRKLTPWTAT
jgi:osmoprotectant transport system permease protein